MADFVTRDEFKELKEDVKNINSKVGDLSEKVIRIGCDIDGLPNKVVAQLVDNLYNNCPRARTIDRLDRGATWIIGLIMTIVIGAVIKIALI